MSVSVNNFATCPLCQSASRIAFHKEGHPIRDCLRCQHRFSIISSLQEHVETVYDDSYFLGGGAGYANYLSEEKLLTERGSWYADLVRRYTKPGIMLDVGAAAGFLLKGFHQKGWTGSGLEPNPRMARLAFEKQGLSVNVGTLEDFAFTEQVDLVSMIQVLGHFVNPLKALHTAAEITKPGGLWLFESWNRDSLTARVFGEHWHEYSPPSVIQWFSPHELTRLAERFGFRQIGRGRALKWINLGHAKSLLTYKLKDSAAGRLAGKALEFLNENWSVPYPSEDLFWAVYRKE